MRSSWGPDVAVAVDLDLDRAVLTRLAQGRPRHPGEVVAHEAEADGAVGLDASVIGGRELRQEAAGGGERERPAGLEHQVGHGCRLGYAAR